MKYLKLVRGEKIYLNDAEAQEVKDYLSSSDCPEFLEVKEQLIKKTNIAGVFFEEKFEQTEDKIVSDFEKSLEKTETIRGWYKEQERLSQETSEKKTERELLLKVKTLWFLRSKSWEIPEKIITKIKGSLMKYFEENPDSAWATSEVYDKFLPSIPVSLKTERTFEAIGETIKKQELVTIPISFDI